MGFERLASILPKLCGSFCVCVGGVLFHVCILYTLEVNYFSHLRKKTWDKGDIIP